MLTKRTIRLAELLSRLADARTMSARDYEELWEELTAAYHEELLSADIYRALAEIVEERYTRLADIA